MRKSKFTEEQIVYPLKQAELKVAVLDVCRKYRGSEQRFYRKNGVLGRTGAWRSYQKTSYSDI